MSEVIRNHPKGSVHVLQGESAVWVFEELHLSVRLGNTNKGRQTVSAISEVLDFIVSLDNILPFQAHSVKMSVSARAFLAK